MRAAGGVCVAPHDLARFGEMIRRRGIAGAQQVVPGEWIDDINARGDAESWARVRRPISASKLPQQMVPDRQA
jgi:CubicO group peptidase (beta-lactamase class C family)